MRIRVDKQANRRFSIDSFYSGPIFTYGAIVKLYPTSKRVLFLQVSTGIHTIVFFHLFIWLRFKLEISYMHSFYPQQPGLFCF